MDWSQISTEELIRELLRREEVEVIPVEPYSPYRIIVDGRERDSDTGPAVLLRVWD